MKNTIYVFLFLFFSCLFSHAQSRISNERDLEIRSSKSHLEDHLFIENTVSADLIFQSLRSESASTDSIESVKADTSKKKKYKVWITLMDQSKKVKGYLVEVNDSAIMLAPTSDLEIAVCCRSCNHTIPISNIRKIKIRKIGSIWTGLVIGASVAFASGLILGASDGDPGSPFSPFEVGFILATAGGTMGISAGYAVGTNAYTIEGNKDVFLLYKELLQNLSWTEE